MQNTTKPIVPLLGMIFLIHFSFGGARLAVTLKTLELSDRSTSLTALALSATYLLPLLGSILLGKWVDRQYKHIPLIVGSAAILLSTLGLALKTSLAGLIFSGLILGGGYQLFQMTVQHTIGKLVPDLERRAAWFSWLSLTNSVSFVLSSVLVGYALEWYSVEYTFFWLSLGPLLVFFLTWGLRFWTLTIPALKPVLPDDQQVANTTTSDLLKHPLLLRVIIVATAVSMAWEIHSFLIPIVGDRRGYTESEIGWIIAGFSFGTLLVRLAMPYLILRFKVWHIIATGLASAIIVYGVYPIITDIPITVGQDDSSPIFYTMVLCSTLLGLGLGAAQPNIMAQLHEHAPYGRSGEASGLRSTFTYCANFMVPLVLGLLSAQFDLLLPFFCLVAVIIAVWVWAFGGTD